MQETQVQSLGQEDPLEKEMATPSCILAWRISWREEPGGLQSMSSAHKELDLTKRLTHFRIMVLEKPLESPLDNKEIKPINLKGNQPWIVTGRTDAENGAPIL